MHKIAFAALFFAALLWACQNKQGQFNKTKKLSADAIDKNVMTPVDTLAYSYINEHAEEPGCDKNCNFESISYPVFKNQAVLNDTVSNHVLYFISEKPNQTKKLKSLVKSWIESSLPYRDTTEDDPEYTVTAGSKFRIVVLKQTPLFVEFRKFDEEDGGAHPFTTVEYFYWDVKRQKQLAFKDFFSNGLSKSLLQILENHFRRINHLKSSATLDSFNFRNNEFNIYEQLRILPNGIQFYGDDESTHCRGGCSAIAFTVPYAELKSLIKPNTIIRQYYKINARI
jgi:hypothetical protein